MHVTSREGVILKGSNFEGPNFIFLHLRGLIFLS